MTLPFSDRRQLETTRSARARLRSLSHWLADQWPKAAIAFGFALTIVWTAVLAWLAAMLVGLA
jgi:hypothetical protein